MYCTADITSTYHKNAGLEAASELLSHTLGHTISSSVTGSTSHRSVWSMAKWASLCAGSLRWSGVGLLYRPRWGCVQSRPSARPSAAVDDSLTPSQRPDYCYTVAHNTYSHTHTHIPFNGPFSGTTQVSRYQKGKTDLDSTEARDSEWQWHQLGHMQVSTSLQTDNHANTPPLRFLQAGCPSCRPTNSVKALKANKT